MGHGILLLVSPAQDNFFFWGMRHFFLKISGINLKKHAFDYQTEQVEWLLSLICTLYDVYVTSLQSIFTYSFVVWNLLISGWC